MSRRVSEDEKAPRFTVDACGADTAACGQSAFGPLL